MITEERKEELKDSFRNYVLSELESMYNDLLIEYDEINKGLKTDEYSYLRELSIQKLKQ